MCVFLCVCVCVCVCNSVTSLHFGNYFTAAEGNVPYNVRCLNTGCPRRNVPDFGRMFLMLKYTDITQNTYIQS